MAKRRKMKANALDELKGWQEIANFLGQPISVAQRWAESGMPVQKRGRNVYSSRDQLNRWLGRETAGEPVQIATKETDLGAELRRGLSFIRKQSKKDNSKRAA
jgi:phage terminase Nu1 subunit (DNA packaging protein)